MHLKTIGGAMALLLGLVSTAAARHPHWQYRIYYGPAGGDVVYYLPPVFAPAELAFGPQAVRHFQGLNREAGLGGIVPWKNPVAETRAAAAPVRAERPVQALPLLAHVRARKFLKTGDDLFRKQRYQDALQEYKSAANAAPDLAEAFFRQGHALMATNRSELAAKAFRRGMALKPNIDLNGFRLDDIYADNSLAKIAHLESLASQALTRPDDANIFFLVGVFLYYDGQVERSHKFFERARLLAGPTTPDLRGFLREQQPEPEALAVGEAI